MIDIVNGGIKDSSYLRIYDCIDRLGRVSRSGIVRSTGLSLSTVNKALDSLLNCGAVIECENPETDRETKRRSEVFRTGTDSDIGIIDITSDRFIYYTFTKTGIARIGAVALFPVLGSPDGHFRSFCCRIKSDGFRPRFVCAVVRPPDGGSVLCLSDILLPAPPPEDSIERIINSILSPEKCTVMSCVDAARFGMNYCKALPPDKNNVYINADSILYIALSRSEVCTASGTFPCGNGKTLVEELSRTSSDDTVINALASFVMSVIPILRPAGIAIYSDRFPKDSGLDGKILNRLSEAAPFGLFLSDNNLPVISTVPNSLSTVGAYRFIKREIFRNILNSHTTY